MSGVDLRGYFDEQVLSGSLDAALDLSVVEFDELAQLASVTVTGVETSAADIHVNYSVAWTSFHACDDRTFGGTHCRMLRGRAEGGGWVFEPHEPLPTRSDAGDEL
jgi:hypothetical protein